MRNRDERREGEKKRVKKVGGGRRMDKGGLHVGWMEKHVQGTVCCACSPPDYSCHLHSHDRQSLVLQPPPVEA